MIAGPEFLILLTLMFPVLTLWAVIDMVRRPVQDFVRAGRNIIVWAMVVVLVPVIGPVLYLSLIRRDLNRASSGRPTSYLATA